MTVGIVGLGLIGGSLAKSLKRLKTHKVLGFDCSESVVQKALLDGAVDGVLESEKLSLCDVVIIALYPKAAAEYINQYAKKFKKDSIVTDCGGVKRFICQAAEQAAAENRFVFIGGHPMAGTENSGFDFSRENLFDGAPMILTPPIGCDKAVSKLSELYTEMGFGKIVISTPQEHDTIIAFTSQLAHVVSSAYVKSPSAVRQSGFSAGSFKDMTRVARLNENMWAELFALNADNLVTEIDYLIESLQEYRQAIKANDSKALKQLLIDGHAKKLLSEEEFQK